MIENKTFGSRLRVGTIYFIVILLALLCLLPVWNMVCMSFSSSTMVMANEVTFFPKDFTLEAYKLILKDAQFFRSFGLSVLRVCLALVINLTMIVLLAYPLSKTVREFNGRNIVMSIMIIAMLFSGGMIPSYLLLKELKLLNTVWALVLPTAVPISNMIMCMNFMTAIPSALEEAAIIDGASPLQVLLRIILPCSKPSLATMALFSIVGHWNDFEAGLIYMTKRENYPLIQDQLRNSLRLRFVKLFYSEIRANCWILFYQECRINPTKQLGESGYLQLHFEICLHSILSLLL